MNGKRPKLLKLLRDQSIKIIVVEHRDRLIRFGFEYLEASLAAQYGKRAAKHQAEKAIRATQDE
ncbi:MAG: hypothetical protein MOB07_18315 [Acidobacteria bacterium]|nr:hypothetical protein [Acidobacteriota bacterium]